MSKPKTDPAMLLCGIVGLMVAMILSALGILPSMYGGGTEGALRTGLIAGAGLGAGLIVWALYRQFRPWQ